MGVRQGLDGTLMGQIACVKGIVGRQTDRWVRGRDIMTGESNIMTDRQTDRT